MNYIGQTTWEVRALLSPGVIARFRDRHNGFGKGRYSVFFPLPDELIEDIAAGYTSWPVFEFLWREFRYHVDRRFNDPFVFWPHGPMVERWKKER